MTRSTPLLTVLGFALTLGACDDTGQTTQQALPPPTVTVTPVVEAEVVETLQFVGRVKAMDEVDIRARVEGFLEERAFEEGQDVAAGDLLFAIEPDRFEADLELRKANLAQARARLTEANQSLVRSKTLVERGAVSQATLDADIAAQGAAMAEVQAQEAQVHQAEIELGYTQITSPIDGRIGESEYSVGNLVNPQSGPLARLTLLDPIHVTVNISERDFVAFRRARIARGQVPDSTEGARAVPTLILPDGSDYGIEGRFDFIDDRVDPGTGTIMVRALFANPDRLLAPGQFVTVVVSGDEPETKLLIPQVAVQQDQQGRFVLVVTPEKLVEQRRVKLGAEKDVSWVVEEGLAPGDLVIIEGLQKIRPGVEVEAVVSEPPLASAQPAAEG